MEIKMDKKKIKNDVVPIDNGYKWMWKRWWQDEKLTTIYAY